MAPPRLLKQCLGFSWPKPQCQVELWKWESRGEKKLMACCRPNMAKHPDRTYACCLIVTPAKSGRESKYTTKERTRGQVSDPRGGMVRSLYFVTRYPLGSGTCLTKQQVSRLKEGRLRGEPHCIPCRCRPCQMSPPPAPLTDGPPGPAPVLLYLLLRSPSFDGWQNHLCLLVAMGHWWSASGPWGLGLQILRVLPEASGKCSLGCCQIL